MKKKLIRLLMKEQKINRVLARSILHMVSRDDGGADDMPPAPEIPGLAIRAEDSLRHYR